MQTCSEYSAIYLASFLVAYYVVLCAEKPLNPAVPVQRPSRRVPGAFDGTTTSRGTSL